jgi:hypothetical protein
MANDTAPPPGQYRPLQGWETEALEIHVSTAIARLAALEEELARCKVVLVEALRILRTR